MLLRVLADENVPWPLVRLLRSMRLNVAWIPETNYRGMSDSEVISLANRDERVVLTRDSDFLKPSLRRKAKYGIIYIGEPVRKDNVKKLATRNNEGETPPNNNHIQYYRAIPACTMRCVTMWYPSTNS